MLGSVMIKLTLDDACDLHDRTVRFLREDVADALRSFSITKSGDNYWRHTREAQKREDREAFRPTVTCFCLEAHCAQLLAIAPDDLEQRRLAWAQSALSALRRLEPPRRVSRRRRALGTLANLRSTMTGGRPNPLSVAHLGMVLGRLEQVRRMSRTPGLQDLDWRLVRHYKALTLRYLKKRLDDGLYFVRGDPEHPYVAYRVVECLSLLGSTVGDSFCQRLAKDFDRLAAGLAHADATPAEGVDLVFLWATAALSEQIPVPARRWESCLDALLELSRPAGDWPLGHALSSARESGVVPSGEVASSILNSLLLPRQWKGLPVDQAMRTLGYIRPLAERVMRDRRSIFVGNREMIGWRDTRLGSDTNLLQSFTTASHILFLSRLVLVLRSAIRRTIISKFSGLEAGFAEGPGFAEISEVDHLAPIGEYLWDKFVRTIDPLAPTLRKYRQLCARGPKPRLEEDRLNLPSAAKKNTSIILYGPPGTGKSTYARVLANALGWPLITITPGNFTRQGEGGIETAAEEVFGWLSRTDRVVVLLDECDELFRRRDKQETGTRTLLNFLTASMLPKLAALHDRGKLVFVIATNYLEQMDLAAIRGGRIDHHVAVPPPDGKSRGDLLRNQVEKALALSPRYRRVLTGITLRRAVKATAGLTRSEIIVGLERFVQSVAKEDRLSLSILAERLLNSLTVAARARLNGDRLLTYFYRHMQQHSNPVLLAGADKWRLPAEMVRGPFKVAR